MNHFRAPAVSWRGLDRMPWGRRARLLGRVDATVTDPVGRVFVVRVQPVLWPGHARSFGGDLVVDSVTPAAVGAVLDLFPSRLRWGIRVFGRRNRLGRRPLIYGEEWRERDACVVRARELADEFAAGRRP